MAKLVTKFQYLKPKQGRDVGGYAKYIATREGVDLIDDTGKLAPATLKQKQFIEKLQKDFPDCKEMLEYEDYIQEQTIGNATELISRVIEENIHEVMNTKTYADYIATRPRAQRFGFHGLFTDDGIQVKLSRVSEELKLHEGNVWTVIISIRREDAERLGFDDGVRWRDMLRTQTEVLATNLKIPMENLKWFAAFHNESHHPHVHLIAYSVNENEGYLTKQGVRNLRSSFASDIFSQDLFCVYQKKNEYRGELRKESRVRVAELIADMEQGTCDSPEVEKMLSELSKRLSNVSGKKVYGYLKADIKALVDRIVDELGKDQRIAELYNLWYEQSEEVKRTYTEVVPDRVPLSQNKEFKSIRNAVIQEAMNILSDRNDIPSTVYQEELEPEMNMEERKTETKTWWTDEYKKARFYYYGTKDVPSDFSKAFELMVQEADRGNGFAMHDLAKMYLLGHGCDKNEEAAQEWFIKTYDAFIEAEAEEKKKDYLQYRIGKLYAFGYGVEQDYLLASDWYQKAVKEHNPFAAYALGSLYRRGQGVEQNDEKAFALYKMAAKDRKRPNAYVAYELGRMCEQGIGTKRNLTASEEWYKVAYNVFLIIEKSMADDKLYYRLGQMNMNGIGTEVDYEKAKQYYEKAAELENVDALYGLGKLYLKKDYEFYDKEKAMEYLKQAAEQGHEYAKRLLEWLQSNHNPSCMSGMINLIYHMSRMFQEKLSSDYSLKGGVDRKLRRQIEEKKKAQGLKQ